MKNTGQCTGQPSALGQLNVCQPPLGAELSANPTVCANRTLFRFCLHSEDPCVCSKLNREDCWSTTRHRGAGQLAAGNRATFAAHQHSIAAIPSAVCLQQLKWISLDSQRQRQGQAPAGRSAWRGLRSCCSSGVHYVPILMAVIWLTAALMLA